MEKAIEVLNVRLKQLLVEINRYSFMTDKEYDAFNNLNDNRIDCVRSLMDEHFEIEEAIKILSKK